MIYKIPTLIDKEAKTLDRTVFEQPKRGIECMFIKLNKKQGVKIFPTESKAKFARKRQRKAYKYGIAPKVYSKVCKCLVDNLRKFDRDGFFIDESGNERMFGYCYITEVAHKGGRHTPKEIKRLEAVYDHLGFKSYDFHGGNLGRINGKLVAIDFGKESTTNW